MKRIKITGIVIITLLIIAAVFWFFKSGSKKESGCCNYGKTAKRQYFKNSYNNRNYTTCKHCICRVAGIGHYCKVVCRLQLSSEGRRTPGRIG